MEEHAGFEIEHLNGQIHGLGLDLGLGLFCQFVDVHDGGDFSLLFLVELEGPQGAVGLEGAKLLERPVIGSLGTCLIASEAVEYGGRLVVGDGSDLSRLQSKAVRLKLGNAVEFAGNVSEERLYAFYRDCSFFVMPSRAEGFGLVFLEAMRAGKPCIGAEGAAAEIIEHGVCG